MLNTIRIVMVNTTLPANIGSAARAMMTATLHQLVLVNPQKPIDDTSYAHAKGGQSILDNAIITQTLHDAIADCSLIFAASSRTRHLPRPVVSPSTAAAIIDSFVKQQPPHTPPNIAVLFGREAHGLTNDELATAHYHLQIDANPVYGVLNIASSIQVIGSFFYAYYAEHYLNANKSAHLPPDSNQSNHKPKHNTLDVIIRQTWDEAAINHNERHKLNAAIIALLEQLQLIDDNMANLPNRLSRLSSRLQLDKKEYALLMTLIYKIQANLTHHLQDKP